jgi:hypothetical protein
MAACHDAWVRQAAGFVLSLPFPIGMMLQGETTVRLLDINGLSSMLDFEHMVVRCCY